MKRVIEFVKKNKENSEESRSSTEESVRGNKEASEQGKKRGRSMEKGKQVSIEYKRLGVQRITSKENQYIGLYIIKEIVSTSVVKLKLPATVRTHLVVNISQVVRYRELVKKQRIKESKLVEVDEEKE